MRRHSFTIRTLISAVALLVPALALQAQGPPPTLPEPTGCEVIDALPAVVGEPGLYCLDDDHAVDLAGGWAIEIQADHVTVDLQGHTIDNTPAGPGNTALGIFSWERGHVVVRNGTLIGFEEAVALSGPFGSSLSAGHLVEGLRVIDSGETGIGVTGSDSIVRGNTVRNTGPSLSTKDPVSGIALGGSRNRAIDNDVIRVVGHPESNVAIRFIFGTSNMALGNRISSAQTAILFPTGQNGFYRDNLANEIVCCDAFVGGTDLGGNVWQ